MSSSDAAASVIVCSGISCIVIATSPKARSRSTTQTSTPVRASATLRLTAMVVLPTPPLGENTMKTWPWRSPSTTPVGPWMASQVLRARVTAVPSAAWSSAATTAPIPACIAWA